MVEESEVYCREYEIRRRGREGLGQVLGVRDAYVPIWKWGAQVIKNNRGAAGVGGQAQGERTRQGEVPRKAGQARAEGWSERGDKPAR